MIDFEKIFLELQKDTTDSYMNKNLIQDLVCCNDELLKLLDNETGNSLLHQAVIYGHYDMALFFIRKGANVNQQNSRNKNTALHLTEGKDLFELLVIKYEANIHAVNNKGDTVLMTQVENRNYENIYILLQYIRDNDDQLRSAVHRIMYDIFNDEEIDSDKQKDIELLGKFISYDQDIIYSTDRKGNSILNLALDHGLSLHRGCSFLPDEISNILIAGYRSKIIAFAMGSSNMLGKQSWVNILPPELIKPIYKQSISAEDIHKENPNSRGI